MKLRRLVGALAFLVASCAPIERPEVFVAVYSPAPPALATTCDRMANGTPCMVPPVVLGQCLLQVCHCFDESGCALPASCAEASCVFGTCEFEPFGCEEPP